MITVLLPLATLSLWAAIAALEMVARDGYRQVPTR